MVMARKRSTAQEVGINARQSTLAGTLIDSGNPLIFSSLNGAGTIGPIYYNGKPLNQAAFDALPDRVKMALVRSYFMYIGISKYEVDISEGGKTEHTEDPKLAVAKGGLTKTVNTGLKAINAGDLVVWNVRSMDKRLQSLYPPGATLFEPTGTPKKKILFCTEPLDYNELVSHASVCDIVHDNGFKFTNMRTDGTIANPLREINFGDYESNKGFYIIDSFVNDLAKFVVHTIAVGRAMIEVENGALRAGAFDVAKYIEAVNAATLNRDFVENGLPRILAHVLGGCPQDKAKSSAVAEEVTRTVNVINRSNSKNAIFLYNAGAMCYFSGTGKCQSEVFQRVFCKAIRSAASKQSFDLVQQNNFQV
jgi:hypothetical protein